MTTGLTTLPTSIQATGNGGSGFPRTAEWLVCVAAAPGGPQPVGKTTKVQIRKTVARAKIGGKWYSFSEGSEVTVPENVAQALRERGIV